MTRHTLSPEATGTVGPGAQWTEDSNGASTQTDPLRCEFAGWLGDDLVSVNPDFVVSGTLADALRASELTGFELRADPVITKSSEFVSESTADFPDRWERLVPGPDSSTASDDREPTEETDVARQGSDLLVSERALALLNDHPIAHARLTSAGNTPETARFTRNQDHADEAARAKAVAEFSAVKESGAKEAARITAVLEAVPAPTSAPPTMNTQNNRKITGDLTRAVAAVGKPIDDEKVLAVLRFVDGTIEVHESDDGWRDYDRNRIDGTQLSAVNVVLPPNAKVKFIQFNFRNPTGDATAVYPRIGELITGVSPFTRESVIDHLGEPEGTTTTRQNTIFDTYKIGRQRVLFYWDADDHSPLTIVVGRKA